MCEGVVEELDLIRFRLVCAGREGSTISYGGIVWYHTHLIPNP